MKATITHPVDRRGRASPQVWFTSDLHLGHGNVISYSKRPFEDVDEMNEALVKNWNERVQPGDLVYCLGDFALCPEDQAVQFAKRLTGQKFLIFGNHDRRLKKNRDFLSSWIWARDIEGITVGDQRIVLCHYPMLTWNQSHRGAWQLHGHCHGSLRPDPHALRVDVGVDCFGYAPVSFSELQKVMAEKSFRPIDHHGARHGEDGEVY